MRLTLVAAASAVIACAEVDPPEPEPVLPADYQTTFVEVRNCRSSIEHNSVFVVVRTAPAAAPIYQGGPFPFPAGTVVVQEEYADARCMQRTRWTVMKKEGEGYDAAGGDWSWYTLDRFQRTIEKGKLAHCVRCHMECRARDFTCAAP